MPVSVIETTTNTVHDDMPLRQACILFANPGETVSNDETRMIAQQLRDAGSVEFRAGIVFAAYH